MFTVTKNIVSFQKGFVCPPNNGMDNRIQVATLQSNLMQWGYMLDHDAFMELSKSDLSFIESYYTDIITYLRVITGGDSEYQPLYKNFPQEVMSLSDFELYLNASIHYWSNGMWEPSTVVYEKPIKFENIKYNMIQYCTEERFSKIFTDLVSINTSLTKPDLEIIKWFVNSGEKLVFPEIIPFKENLCTLASMGIEGLPIKTTTDVLRIAVHLSGGDISLPKVPSEMIHSRGWTSRKNPLRENFKFKKFSRKERKYILGLLEKTNCDPKEMVLKDQRWIRLGEILHPFEYKRQFPKSASAFQKIRNEKVQSWYGYVDSEFKKGLENGLKVLSQRPGEFSRRIDSIIRKHPKDVELIMKYFSEAVQGTSNKVLFELFEHFEKRMDEQSSRSIMIKGSRKKTTLPTLSPIDSNVVETIHSKIFETLKNKFSTLETLGNCWIDDELKKIPLPSNMRSMNFSNKPVIRGQRIPFDNQEAKVIRPFVHWMDKDGSEDLDLSATFVGDGKCNVLSFSNMKVGLSVHSGDVRHRKGPCAEYIDLDIEDAIKLGFSHILIDVRNFNGNSLSSVKTMFGLMERKFPESNETWLPETISNCQSLQSESTTTFIAILDLVNREYIMLDIDSDKSVTARGNSKEIMKLIDEYSKLPKVSVYDLVLLHVEGRGRQVTLDNNVNTFFKFEDYSNSYEQIGKLMGI